MGGEEEREVLIARSQLTRQGTWGGRKALVHDQPYRNPLLGSLLSWRSVVVMPTGKPAREERDREREGGREGQRKKVGEKEREREKGGEKEINKEKGRERET